MDQFLSVAQGVSPKELAVAICVLLALVGAGWFVRFGYPRLALIPLAFLAIVILTILSF